ncbi:MAG: universal stress protein [Deltaproteobacteria bacterium]|nr:universal stress protein [Deltaproteobacteria bacterium]
MKRVLIPYDFSHFSRRALSLAMQGYPFGGDAEVEMLHVIDEALYENVLSRSHVPTEAAIHSYLQADIDRVRADMFDPDSCKIHPIIKVLRGRPADLILEASTTFSAAAVMIGGQGHGGIKEAFIGRTAQRVARESTCHVYVVKTTGTGRPPRRVLCAVDRSPPSRKALEEAHRLAVLNGAKLSIISAIENPYLPYIQKLAMEIHDDEAVKELVQAERERLLKFEIEVLGANKADTHHAVFGPVIETLNSHAEILHAGTIIMGPRGLGPVGRAFLGSVTEQMLLRSRVDVLVVK